MQAIDVLRDKTDQLTLRIERLHEVVADVGFGALVLFPAVQPSLPRLNARRFAVHIFLKSHRPVARPDAAGAAKIRNARFRADARAREDDDLAALANFSREFF